MSEAVNVAKLAPPAGWDACEGTLARELRIAGRGLHTGRLVNVAVLPVPDAEKKTGIVFRRVNGGKVLAELQPVYQAWRNHPLCSTLQAKNGLLFRTVEHLLAALLFCEITHAVVELDEEEVPILDGGAKEWSMALKDCGRIRLSSARRFIKVTRPFEYRFGDTSLYTVEPDNSFGVDAEVKVSGFASMRWQGALSPETFFTQIAPARSYGHLLAAVPAIIGGWLAGTPILRGARLHSVAAIFNRRVIGGMALPDEFARHRVLDMLGDFAIAGAPLLGKVKVYQPSHRRNQKFMRTLLGRNKDCWEWVTFP